MPTEKMRLQASQEPKTPPLKIVVFGLLSCYTATSHDEALFGESAGEWQRFASVLHVAAGSPFFPLRPTSQSDTSIFKFSWKCQPPW